MFGNADWFKTREGRLLVPRSARGIAYLLGWPLAILIPAWWLAEAGLFFPEMLIWIVLAGGFFTWDYRRTVRRVSNRYRLERLHYIADSDEGAGESGSASDAFAHGRQAVRRDENDRGGVDLVAHAVRRRAAPVVTEHYRLALQPPTAQDLPRREQHRVG